MWERRVLKREKGKCGEFSTKARRGLEVIVILDQGGSLEALLEQGNQHSWNKEIRLGELPFPVLMILYAIALYIDAWKPSPEPNSSII